MIYVMSDLHGEYEKYLMMLEKIHFKEEDTLFILGDVLDRGKKPMAILKDMMSRANVYPILGNHESMALPLLKLLSTEITEKNLEENLNEQLILAIMEWQMNGGQTTIDDFQSLSQEERLDILDYLQEFSLYEVIDVQEKSFILVHAGLGNFSKHKKLSEYPLADLIWTRPNHQKVHFDDENIDVICGHTPTQSLTQKAEIYHVNHHIYIDCGACFHGGKLACLCLDTMKEFYV